MKEEHPEPLSKFPVKLTSTSDDVFTGLGDPGLCTWVRFGEAFETFNELGEIGSVLDLNRDLDDGGDGELHDLHVVGGLRSGEGTALEQELIDTNKTNDVTGRTVFERLDITSHHEDGTLDRLDKQVILLSGNVVGTLDTDLGASTDGTGEDTSKCIETSLVGCGDHLGDVQDQRSLWITVTDPDGGLIVRPLDPRRGSQHGSRGGKVYDNHL